MSPQHADNLTQIAWAETKVKPRQIMSFKSNFVEYTCGLVKRKLELKIVDFTELSISLKAVVMPSHLQVSLLGNSV
jgi:hypothetical protein